MSNPYSHAAGAYGAANKQKEGRDLEAAVLLKSALQMEQLARRLSGGENVSVEETDTVLTHNRKIWEVFLDDMSNPEHPVPQTIKNNVASLAVFVFKKTIEILAAPSAEKITVLVDINRSIASGLSKKVPGAAPPASPTTEAGTKTPPTAGSGGIDTDI